MKNQNMHSTLEPNKRTLNGDNNESESINRRMRSDLSKMRNQSNQRSRVGVNIEQNKGMRNGHNEGDISLKGQQMVNPEMNSFSRNRQRQNSEVLRESSSQSFNQKLKALSQHHSPDAGIKNKKSQKASNCSKS